MSDWCLLTILFTYFLVPLLFAFTPCRVRYADIQELTLTNTIQTYARRLQPRPQLECIGGSAGCGYYEPTIVQCYNHGFDGFDVQWKCEGDLRRGIVFGETYVSCEGYEYNNDAYVLGGSCGLKYKLEHANKNIPVPSSTVQQHSNYQYSDYRHWLIPLLIILAVLLCCLIPLIIGLCCLLNKAFREACFKRFRKPGEKFIKIDLEKPGISPDERSRMYNDQQNANNTVVSNPTSNQATILNNETMTSHHEEIFIQQEFNEGYYNKRV